MNQSAQHDLKTSAQQAYTERNFSMILWRSLREVPSDPRSIAVSIV